MKRNSLIICRGGGDLATGIVHRLHRAGFRVLVLETDHPAAIRRQVSFCEAVYEGKATVEGVTAQRIDSVSEMEEVFARGCVPLFVDSKGASIAELHPDVVVDAIIAKKNLGTTKEMAPLVIGVGPGFNVVNVNSTELVVFEAAIDLMSYVDIFADYESNKLALGMLADAPLETFLREHPQITSIRFCLDGDEPGRKAAAELMRKYYELGYEVEDCPPPAGYKDYNEWLVAAKLNLNQMNQRADEPVRA